MLDRFQSLIKVNFNDKGPFYYGFREAEPVEDEKPEVEEGVEEEEEESPMMSEEGESPPVYLPEEGSGVYEGSGFMADYATGAADTGSGEDLKPYKGNYSLFTSHILLKKTQL